MQIEEIRETAENYRDDIIASLQKLISFESTEGEKEAGKPFGPEVDACLQEALNLGDKFGLKTSNIDGYAGTIEIGSEKEMLGILCHLDVVPAGDDWTFPPFSGVVEDGKIYGRGTLDNKGPAVGVIYALNIIQELDIDLHKRVRLILGTNEESGFGGITYYAENEELPDIAFSPDAVFPVIHAEKGIMIFDLKADFSNHETKNNSGKVTLKSIKGGNAPNMVPDRCKAKIVGDHDYLQEKVNAYNTSHAEELELNRGDNYLHLVYHGVSAHGSKPQDGKNAISHLINFLVDLDLETNSLSSFCRSYKELIGLDYFGQKMNCDLEDDVSGKLVFNAGEIVADNNNAKVTVNIRYPVKEDAEKVYSLIDKEIADHGWKLNKDRHKKPLFVEKDDPLVSSLMEVYQKSTGDESEPIAIGGGTYARAVPKGVAFGPLFPGEPELAHQKDEYIKIDDLIENVIIYTGAIIALASEDELE